MTSRATKTIFVISADVILSVVLVFISYLNNSYSEKWPESLYLLKRFLYGLQVPAIFIGAWISNNTHQPNMVATYGSLFLIYLIMIAALFYLLQFAYSKTKKRDFNIRKKEDS
jgi:hypothetical protein